MKRICGPLVGLLAVLCAPAVPAEEESPWNIDGELVIGHDSNVSRAALSRDVVDDNTTLLSLAAAWTRELDLMSAVTLRGFLEGEAFSELDSLNRRSAGVQAIYRWQYELGYTAPFFQASLSAQQDDFDSSLRDADRYVAQAFVTRRFTDALRGSFGMEWSRSESDGVVFDVDQRRFFANLDLALNRHWAVYGTYAQARGDTISSAQLVFCNGATAPDIYPLIDASDAVETDEALNAALCGSWLAYRLPAMTHAFTFGANRGFGHSASLDLSVQHVEVLGRGDNDYQRTLLRAGILARF